MAAGTAFDDAPPRECDAVVVGAGIVGLAVARELALRRPGAKVAVLEREPAIAAHQTGASSGVVHSGIYYRPGSLKARLCVEGSRDLYAYCEARGIRTERSGKLVVAADESELDRLAELERRGRENGVAGLRRVAPDEIAEIEPHAAGVAALHSPATGVVDFGEVAAALAADLRAAGGTITTGCPVTGLGEAAGHASIRHRLGETRASAAIVCAGLWSDRLAVAAGAPADPRIVPFRGAYLRLRPERGELVRANIYPVPDPDLPFLGMHATRGLSGEVRLGPSALMVGARDAYSLRTVRPRDVLDSATWPGTWRMVARHARTAATEIRAAASRGAFVAQLRRLIPELSTADVEPGPAGVRAQAVTRAGELVDDFVVHRTETALHVRNAPSPAATACLALAREIADRAEAELGLV